MLEKIKTALLTVIAMLLAGILFTLATYQPEDSTRTWAEDSLEQCAFCGAHVTEVWHAKDADGNFVHVCSKCVDEYYAEKL